MLHNNYTQQDYKSYHVILPADIKLNIGELLLGDLNAATDQNLMREHNVKTIITAATGLQHLKIPSQQTHVIFPLLDIKSQNIQSYFDLSYQTIQQNLKRGGVLVHCGAGISRSATLVIAYYMRRYDNIFSNAIKYVRKIRPNICPNLGFQLQLKKYQERLETEKSKSTNNSKAIHNNHNKSNNQQKQFLQTKNMLLTFNAPLHQNKPRNTNSNFSTHTPIFNKKITNFSTSKKNKIQHNDLFILGHQAGQKKVESTYNPSKYSVQTSNNWIQPVIQNKSFKY